jgi:hypothetical protein
VSDGLTLEKAKVVERLNTLETKFDIYIKQVQDNNEKLNHIIIGNGQQGLVDKVRNLEDEEKKRKDYLKVTWVAIIGLACKSVWEMIGGK